MTTGMMMLRMMMVVVGGSGEWQKTKEVTAATWMDMAIACIQLFVPVIRCVLFSEGLQFESTLQSWACLFERCELTYYCLLF